MLCARGRVPGKRLRGNYLDDIERDRFLEAAAALAAAPLYIDDSSSHTVSEIAAAARRLKRKSGLAMIVIDYLTLIEPDNPTEPRQNRSRKQHADSNWPGNSTFRSLLGPGQPRAEQSKTTAPA